MALPPAPSEVVKTLAGLVCRGGEALAIILISCFLHADRRFWLRLAVKNEANPDDKNVGNADRLLFREKQQNNHGRIRNVALLFPGFIHAGSIQGLRQASYVIETEFVFFMTCGRRCLPRGACFSPMHDILPSLKPFLAGHTLDDMKAGVIKGDRHWLTTQALLDLDAHIRAVRDEFTGQHEIAFYHTALVIKIRRQDDLANSLCAFRELWNSRGV